MSRKSKISRAQRNEVRWTSQNDIKPNGKSKKVKVKMKGSEKCPKTKLKESRTRKKENYRWVQTQKKRLKRKLYNNKNTNYHSLIRMSHSRGTL